MTDRKNGMMNNSKNDFDKALTGVIGAYTHLSGANSELPPAYVDVLQDYIWLQDGLSKLQSAIKNGGTFYVSEPSGNTYNNSAANAIIGINMGKLFTPGQFAIDKLISTESGGKAPQFYVFNGETPTAVTNKEQLNNLGESYLGFRIKFGPIKEVVVKGLDDMLSEDTMDMPLFPAKIGKDLYGLYHK
jgi:hypothetical protein